MKPLRREPFSFVTACKLLILQPGKKGIFGKVISGSPCKPDAEDNVSPAFQNACGSHSFTDSRLGMLLEGLVSGLAPRQAKLRRYEGTETKTAGYGTTTDCLAILPV